MEFNWSPCNPQESFKFTFGNFALIILNREINISLVHLEDLWNKAHFKAIVDGGADRLYNYLSKNDIDPHTKLPDLLSGDMDSITEKTLHYYLKNGTRVERTPDQNYTDLQKCLKLIPKLCTVKLDSIVILTTCSGRLDQSIQDLNTLGMMHTFTGQDINLYILNKDSLIWHLKEGKHTIQIPKYLRDKSVWCAILPYDQAKDCVTTTGLKWNISNESIEFGGLISSSNTYGGDPFVTITSTKRLSWCMGLLS